MDFRWFCIFNNNDLRLVLFSCLGEIIFFNFSNSSSSTDEKVPKIPNCEILFFSSSEIVSGV